MIYVSDIYYFILKISIDALALNSCVIYTVIKNTMAFEIIFLLILALRNRTKSKDIT
jgi:hypothetical protein